MIERDGDTLVRRVRSIMREIEELKTAQRVGDSQIEIKYTNTGNTMLKFSTVPNADNEYMTAMGKAKISITCNDIKSPNALIAYCLPEIHQGSPTGPTITPDGTYTTATIFSAKSTGYNNARWNIQVFDISSTGTRLSAKDFYVKFHIWAAVHKIDTIDWGSGNYE